MALNKSKGNMYPWADVTYNHFGNGICPHKCKYCYMWDLWKMWGWIDKGRSKLIERKLQDKFPKKPITIFEGSACDMWARAIPRKEIQRVLEHHRQYPQHTYVYQSKNPIRFYSYQHDFPPHILFGTTLESNRNHGMSKAPIPLNRASAMTGMKSFNKTFISVEPILDFDLKVFIEWLKIVEPLFVSIGADSQHHKLPEPPPEKVAKLIEELKKFTEVKIKPNLKRLLKP